MPTASVTFTTENDSRLNGNIEKKEKGYIRVRGICVGEKKNKLLNSIAMGKTEKSEIEQCEVVKEFYEINKIEEQRSMM